MEKVDLTKQFACRLRDAMLAAGYNSQRSTSGVCVHKLSEITGYSEQICRKYLRGEAIPEPIKLVEVAAHLKVSPGWLLFGDSHDEISQAEGKLTISKNLLQHILIHSKALYNSQLDDTQVSSFLVELIQDVSLIKTDEEQSLKVIDLALSAFNHFNKLKGMK